MANYRRRRCREVVGQVGRAVPSAPCARRFTFPPESVSLEGELAMATTTDKTSPQEAWTPTSWQMRQAAQQPVYPDPDALHRALGQLAKLPPARPRAGPVGQTPAIGDQLGDREPQVPVGAGDARRAVPAARGGLLGKLRGL